MQDRADPPARSPGRILIADTSGQVRRRLREALSDAPEFVVVGEVAQVHDITASCASSSPDVLLIGLGDSGDGGYSLAALAALGQALQADPSIGAVVLVNGRAAEELTAALRAGARAIVRRDASRQRLVEALSDVMAGGTALDPSLTGTVFAYLANNDRIVSADGMAATMSHAVRQALSPREQEVILALARGSRNEQIAEQLGVSVGTVKTHLLHIYRKLEVQDRISAVLTAFQLRLSEADDVAQVI